MSAGTGRQGLLSALDESASLVFEFTEAGRDADNIGHELLHTQLIGVLLRVAQEVLLRVELRLGLNDVSFNSCDLKLESRRVAAPSPSHPDRDRAPNQERNTANHKRDPHGRPVLEILEDPRGHAEQDGDPEANEDRSSSELRRMSHKGTLAGRAA